MNSIFFLCDADRLAEGFPGWKPPRTEPVVRVSINPFTKEEIRIEDRDPRWLDSEIKQFFRQESRLREETSSFIHARPHWQTTNVSHYEIELLLEKIAPLTEVAFALDYPPDGTGHPGATVIQIPKILVEHILACVTGELKTLAESWADAIQKAMPPSAFTKAVRSVLRWMGKPIQDTSREDAVRTLESLASLAKQQSASQSMYLYTEY